MAEEEDAATEEKPRFPMAEEPPELERDEDDPGEVPSRFATKGFGWSGREDSEL